jgi:hypothetical protein
MIDSNFPPTNSKRRYTAKHLAAEVGSTPKQVRRHLRAKYGYIQGLGIWVWTEGRELERVRAYLRTKVRQRRPNSKGTSDDK